VTAAPSQNVAIRALHCFRDFFKTQWQRTSLFVLAVVVFSAVIAFWNYRLQLKSSEPQLASAGSVVSLSHPIYVELYFSNIGKRPTKQGTVSLFPFNQAHTRGQKLVEKAIAAMAGGSNFVLPQSAGKVIFDVEGEAPDLFLACLIYFDGKTRLRQAFVYRLGGRASIPTLYQIEQPDYGEVCN
jgi:hypothetical protein